MAKENTNEQEEEGRERETLGVEVPSITTDEVRNALKGMMMRMMMMVVMVKGGSVVKGEIREVEKENKARRTSSSSPRARR